VEEFRNLGNVPDLAMFSKITKDFHKVPFDFQKRSETDRQADRSYPIGFASKSHQVLKFRVKSDD
jgi:hypothetical protein